MLSKFRCFFILKLKSFCTILFVLYFLDLSSIISSTYISWRPTMYKPLDLRGLYVWLFFLVKVVMCINISSVQFSHSVMSNSLQPHGLQPARLLYPSPIPRVCSNSSPSSRWCHPTISSSVMPFSSCLQSCPATGSFPISQFFTSGCQSTGASASASVLPMNIQDWFPSRWIRLISLQSKELSRVFSNTTFQKHQFFDTQPFFLFWRSVY